MPGGLLFVKPQVPVRNPTLELAHPTTDLLGVVVGNRRIADLDGGNLGVDLSLDLFPDSLLGVEFGCAQEITG